MGLAPRDALVEINVEELLGPFRYGGLTSKIQLKGTVRPQHLYALVTPVGNVDMAL